MPRVALALLLCSLVLPSVADARCLTHRSQAVRRQFQRLHLCPSTGLASTTVKCKGYIIDHVQALACGGRDSPDNMAWMTIEAAKAKDAWERKGCHNCQPARR